MFSFVLDWLMPRWCLGCQVEGTWLCDGCIELLRQERLGHVYEGDGDLSGIVAALPFHSGVLREVIHTLKYDGVTELAVPLGLLLAESLELQFQFNGAVVVPVPLHPSRQAERGYNQAELIARQLSNYKDERLLIRYRARPPQAKLDREARQANISGVFGVPVSAVPTIKDCTILLVDDVATTGSTLKEAAGVLVRAGAASVWGAVIAKG